MYTIKTLNAISPVGLAKLPKNQFDVTVDADAPDGILVRSADLLNTTFNDNLLAIARAGAGVNNIPLERCSEQGIVVFNTPGANANAVAELVIGMLIAGSRNVAAAAQWCQGLAGDPAMAKSVEKGKKQFVGNEIKGKTLGVIGLGAIGSRVANCAIELGMEVYGYDPYISIEAAWNLSSQVHHCVNLNDMLPLCDYITIHVPYLPTTKDTINTQTLALCKDGVKILNYARGELVNTEALLEAMETGKVSGYMTDFPSEAILGKPGIVCTPHLGASTPEAEDNCAVMAAKELSDYLKNGNIIHSVNMPEVNQPRAGGKRMERRRTVPDPGFLRTGHGKVPSGGMGHWPRYVTAYAGNDSKRASRGRHHHCPTQQKHGPPCCALRGTGRGPQPHHQSGIQQGHLCHAGRSGTAVRPCAHRRRRRCGGRAGAFCASCCAGGLLRERQHPALSHPHRQPDRTGCDLHRPRAADGAAPVGV